MYNILDKTEYCNKRRIHTSDFMRNLYRLNHTLHVKNESIDRHGFPIVGLYSDNTFIMAIPRYYVPEYSISYLNITEIRKYDPQRYTKLLETGIDNGEQILCRGWRAILSGLIKLKYIGIKETERIFNDFRFMEKITEYPRNYINKEI